MTLREWLLVAAVLTGLGIGLPLVRRVVAKTAASAEVARKSVHVAMGLACAMFPWVFDRPLPVWVLAGFATVALSLVRCIPAIRQGIGSALHGIQRPSYGEILFAPAVALVFHLAGDHRFLHFIPILILAVADAAGALGGTRWGRRRYGSGEGFKSVEGSLIFLVAAFLCAFFPLLCGMDKPPLPSTCIALILATLAMMGEGLSDRGFDNLVIPLGCYYVLQRIVDLETPSLFLRLLVLVAVLGIILRTARWTTLNGGALLGSALLGYGCAVIGDWRFALPPVAVFLCHVFKTRKHQLTGVFDHRLDAVLSHAIASMPWVIAFARDRATFHQALAGISFAMATQLAIGDFATRLWLANLSRPIRCTIKGWWIAATPGLVWFWPAFGKLKIAAPLAFVLSFAWVCLYRKLQPDRTECPTRAWVAIGLLAFLSSLPALLITP